jgi:hypothetical protein
MAGSGAHRDLRHGFHRQNAPFRFIANTWWWNIIEISP